jgi:hypothetical protein
MAHHKAPAGAGWGRPDRACLPVPSAGGQCQRARCGREAPAEPAGTTAAAGGWQQPQEHRPRAAACGPHQVRRRAEPPAPQPPPQPPNPPTPASGNRTCFPRAISQCGTRQNSRTGLLARLAPRARRHAGGGLQGRRVPVGRRRGGPGQRRGAGRGRAAADLLALQQQRRARHLAGVEHRRAAAGGRQQRLAGAAGLGRGHAARRAHARHHRRAAPAALLAVRQLPLRGWAARLCCRRACMLPGLQLPGRPGGAAHQRAPLRAAIRQAALLDPPLPPPPPFTPLPSPTPP